MPTPRAALLPCLLLLAACPGTRYLVQPLDRETPVEAFRTFRAAVLAERPDVIYESFSDEFKESLGIPDYRSFKAGFETNRSRFRDLARVMEEARLAAPPVVRTVEGRRFAVITLTALGRRVDFLLVDVPTALTKLRLPDYDETAVAERYLSGPDFSPLVRVEDGTMLVGPVDVSETGISRPAEVVGFRLFHKWLLADIRRPLPPEIEDLLDRLRRAGGPGEP